MARLKKRIKPKRNWGKVNLISHKDGTDTYQCSECGFTKKYLLNRPQDCPKCTERELKNLPFSWWSSGTISVCSICNREALIVPRTDHPLSNYWKYERPGDYLFYCEFCKG
jgi:hypothetical protein